MTEAWLAGPVEGVDPLLMPAAHSFLQVRQETTHLLDGLAIELLWTAPGASASIGFHAIHLAGATDRLLTYARGEALSDSQAEVVRGETTVTGLDTTEVLGRVVSAMDAAVAQVRGTPRETLTAVRFVGRRRLASTVLGLIFHAAEHATRHVGQIATIRKIVCS
jgi:DinB superfamily